MKSLIYGFALSLVTISTAHAGVLGENAVDEVVSTLFYSFMGLVMAIIAYKLIDLITPGDLNKEIIDEHNTAASIIVGSLILGVCIIIAAIMTT